MMGKISNSDIFLEKLKKDVKQYERQIAENRRLKNINDIRFAVGIELDRGGPKYHSVQDLFGGIAKNAYYPMVTYGHDRYYWKDMGTYGPAEEAFAHMYEAMFEQEKQVIMAKYFPDAWGYFLTMMEGAAQ
jgi:hypothetical protein